eukprot:gene15692-biopygen9736
MISVIFCRPAWPPQAPGLAQWWTTGILSTMVILSSCKQSSAHFKPSLGDAKRLKRSRRTLVGKRSAGALHRLSRRFQRARSTVRATETSGIPG